MLESLQKIDADLLLFFNHLNNSFLDSFFYWISYKWTWVPLYLLLALILFRRFGNHVFIQLLFIAILITISDQLSSSVIKNVVMRLRPCHEPDIAPMVHLVNGYCGGQYGFVSSHAANTFALVSFLSGLLPERKILFRFLWAWTILVAFSRIYLGVHYPGDVLGGIIIGYLAARLISFSYRYYCINFTSYGKYPPPHAHV